MDSAGRLSRLEMREAVRRRLDTLRYLVTAGVEGALLQTDPLVTDQDINLFLNTALIKRSVDVNIADNTIMADEDTIDIKVNIVEYSLPADLMFLRGVYWKPDGIKATIVPPNERIFMYELDSDNNIEGNLFIAQQVPTYRRRLNLIVLNQVPQIDNPGGLLIDYVKTFLPLAVDNQVIETPLATIIQEVVILDTAIEAAVTKMKVDATELRQSLAELEQRLTLAVVNYHAPKTVRLVSMVSIVSPPYGRRNFGWQRRCWWG